MTPTMLMILIPVVIGLSFLLIMAFHPPRVAPRLEDPDYGQPDHPASRSGTQRLLVAVDGSATSAATLDEIGRAHV